MPQIYKVKVRVTNIRTYEIKAVTSEEARKNWIDGALVDVEAGGNTVVGVYRTEKSPRENIRPDNNQEV